MPQKSEATIACIIPRQNPESTGSVPQCSLRVGKGWANVCPFASPPPKPAHPILICISWAASDDLYVLKRDVSGVAHLALHRRWDSAAVIQNVMRPKTFTFFEATDSHATKDHCSGRPWDVFPIILLGENTLLYFAIETIAGAMFHPLIANCGAPLAILSG